MLGCSVELYQSAFHFKMMYAVGVAFLFMDRVKKWPIRSIYGMTSNWLTVMPLAWYCFDLAAVEFWDALVLHYHHPLLCVLAACDGCGARSSLEHALDCLNWRPSGTKAQ